MQEHLPWIGEDVTLLHSMLSREKAPEIDPAIPRYTGTRCYDTIPFQFSMHSEDSDGNVSHREFLQTDDSDPRRPLAEALLDAAGDDGTICVYSGFERRVIKALSRDLPDLSPELDALLERLWDLLKVVQRNYYHPDFHGSFSIKQVLPVLVPAMSYEDLTIGDGREASAAYQISLDCDDPQERQRIHDALRRYCGQDTLAMLELRHALVEKTSGDPAGSEGTEE